MPAMKPKTGTKDNYDLAHHGIEIRMPERLSGEWIAYVKISTERNEFQSYKLAASTQTHLMELIRIVTPLRGKL